MFNRNLILDPLHAKSDFWPMIPIDKLEQIKQRLAFLEAKMSEGSARDDFAALSKEYSDLRPVVEKIKLYQTLTSNILEVKSMLSDPEMCALAA